jgi:cyclase
MRALPLVLLLASGTAFAQEPDFSKVEIKTTKLTDQLYVLEGMGGNIAVSVGEDGVILVDDQFAPLSPKILAAVAKLSKKPLRFVINTHWHGDHVGGNENMTGAGAVIVAHENVRKRMSTKQFLKSWNMTTEAQPKAALPVVTFTSDIAFHFNGETVHVIHLDPAHTDGDSFVWFEKANVVHTGDVFSTVGYPIVDLDSGGSYFGFIAAADRFLATGDAKTRLVPGHGAVSSKADVQAWKTMLTTIGDRVKKGRDQKQSLDQIKASKPTGEYEARYGKGFMKSDRLLETVYQSLGN